VLRCAWHGWRQLLSLRRRQADAAEALVARRLWAAAAAAFWAWRWGFVAIARARCIRHERADGLRCRSLLRRAMLAWSLVSQGKRLP
jgi:hypothetical protein